MYGAENRIDTRYEIRAPIMYSNYFKNPHCYYGGEMQNYCKKGIFFISKYELSPGSIIYFRKAIYGLDSISQKIEEINWGRVVWCKDTKKYYKYGYGIAAENIDSTFRNDSVKIRQITEGNDPIKQIKSDVLTDDNQTICDIPECKSTKLELKNAIKIADSRAKKLETLNHFASAVSSTLDLKEILKIICKEMVKIFHARNTGIGLLNSANTKLAIVAFYSEDEDEKNIAGLEIPVAGNAATISVIKHGETIIVPDAQNNPITDSYHEIASIRGTHCIMIVPLLSRGQVIGTIGIPTSDPKRVYTTSDVSLAQTIASQISRVIENARLHEETERTRDQVEQELIIGRDIQSEFFPETLPDIPGWEIASHYRASRTVSGDFYDVFPLENDRMLGLVIADVCDKGVGAALYMALSRTLIRAIVTGYFADGTTKSMSLQAKSEKILKNTISLVNNYIAEAHKASGIFATIFLGILSLDNGTVTYINCGHLAPLIIGKNVIKSRLNLSGHAVGVRPNISFDVNQIQLEDDDIIFAYTDGLTDAQDQSGGMFGYERLCELLTKPFRSASHLVNQVVSGINDFNFGAEQYDDITILAIRKMEAL
jgi:sigma-B regulation protein RsbU (phosphoserine phosphatase)